MKGKDVFNVATGKGSYHLGPKIPEPRPDKPASQSHFLLHSFATTNYKRKGVHYWLFHLQPKIIRRWRIIVLSAAILSYKRKIAAISFSEQTIPRAPNLPPPTLAHILPTRS